MPFFRFRLQDGTRLKVCEKRRTMTKVNSTVSESADSVQKPDARHERKNSSAAYTPESGRKKTDKCGFFSSGKNTKEQKRRKIQKRNDFGQYGSAAFAEEKRKQKESVEKIQKTFSGRKT